MKEVLEVSVLYICKNHENKEEREVEEEGLVLVGLHPGHGFLGHPVFEGFEAIL